ncbi:sortase [Candidatus Berkelbacteria bacterium]|nr:sortase [Candidatus Berkelbacteria bacterium]
MRRPNVPALPRVASLLLLLIVIGGAVAGVQAKSARPVTPVQEVVAEETALEVPPKSESYSLVIEELKLDVPIVEDVPGTDEKAYLAALTHGVAHYAGTPKPGQAGNSFIFGHSAYLKGDKGDYNEVFRELNKLIKDETFIVKHNDEVLNYKVFRSEVVEANDFSILDQTDQEIVTLMTCWPPGTIEKRWVVQAERVKS